MFVVQEMDLYINCLPSKRYLLRSWGTPPRDCHEAEKS